MDAFIGFRGGVFLWGRGLSVTRGEESTSMEFTMLPNTSTTGCRRNAEIRNNEVYTVKVRASVSPRGICKFCARRNVVNARPTPPSDDTMIV